MTRWSSVGQPITPLIVAHSVAKTSPVARAQLVPKGIGVRVEATVGVAAGGIADGRGLAAALLLGAVGGWLGPRSVASHEWGAQAWTQAAVLDATADDTALTTVYDQVREAPFPEGIAERVLRNRFDTEWEGRPEEIAVRRDEPRAELKAAGGATLALST